MNYNSMVISRSWLTVLHESHQSWTNWANVMNAECNMPQIQAQFLDLLYGAKAVPTESINRNIAWFLSFVHFISFPFHVSIYSIRHICHHFSLSTIDLSKTIAKEAIIMACPWFRTIIYNQQTVPQLSRSPYWSCFYPGVYQGINSLISAHPQPSPITSFLLVTYSGVTN